MTEVERLLDHLSTAYPEIHVGRGGLVAKILDAVRAEQNERIAQAIETEAQQEVDDLEEALGHGVGRHSKDAATLRRAGRIARNGGAA